MALADTVTGGGYVISSSRETGSYTYTVSGINNEADPPVDISVDITVNYVETRVEYKWYALTQQACMDYMQAHPDYVLEMTNVDPRTNAYELTRSVVIRQIT